MKDLKYVTQSVVKFLISLGSKHKRHGNNESHLELYYTEKP